MNHFDPVNLPDQTFSGLLICNFCGKMVICGTKLTLDTMDFDESMFPERCHCD